MKTPSSWETGQGIGFRVRSATELRTEFGLPLDGEDLLEFLTSGPECHGHTKPLPIEMVCISGVWQPKAGRP